MRREIPIAITLIVGLTMLLSNFVDVPLGSEYSLKSLASELGGWVIIISAFAVGLASVNLVRIHSNHIRRRSSNWIYSVLLLVFLVGWTVMGILEFHNPESEALRTFSQNMFNSILSSLGAAMFALVALYLASAANRAFRVRNLDAAILLGATLIMMLGRAPVGALIWDKFPVMADWMLSVPNNVGQRAIMIGAAIGAFATSLRILLGIERGHLGSE